MIPLPPAVERLSPIEQDIILSNNNNNWYPQIAHILEAKFDKIILTDDRIEEFHNFALQRNSGSIAMEEEILQLRSGADLSPLTKVLFRILLIWIMQNSDATTQGFTRPYFGHTDPTPRIAPKVHENPLDRNLSTCKKAQNNSINFFDGFIAKIDNTQLDHIVSKHGHQWNIDDIDVKGTEGANRNSSPGVPKQVRTRTTAENRRKLLTNIRDMASRSDLEVFPNYPISGDMGRAYLCPDTGLFLGIDTNNIIRKAYIASGKLIRHLQNHCK
nr:hypothetical protein [Cylindrotheca closterium]